MTRTDTARTLLTSVSIFTSRDWGSSEKNNAAIELARRIEMAVTLRDEAEMQKLVSEIKFFMSVTFLLFRRMELLVQRHSRRTWLTPGDTKTWNAIMERTSTIIKRKDGEELVEIAPRIIKFLGQRNGHVFAQGLEVSLKIAKQQRC